MYVVNLWHEINSIADDETGVEDMCLCMKYFIPGGES